MKILFVCTGNSCRSQMAEGLAARDDFTRRVKKFLKEKTANCGSN